MSSKVMPSIQIVGEICEEFTQSLLLEPSNCVEIPTNEDSSHVSSTSSSGMHVTSSNSDSTDVNENDALEEESKTEMSTQVEVIEPVAGSSGISQSDRSASPSTNASTSPSTSTVVPVRNMLDAIGSYDELVMVSRKKCPKETEISYLERNNVDVEEIRANPRYRCLFDQKIVNKYETAYLMSQRAIIALDQEAQTIYLEQFTCEIKLVFHMHLKFSFAVPDGYFGIIAAIDENDLCRFTLTSQSTGDIPMMGNILYVQDSNVYIKILPHCLNLVMNTYKYENFLIEFHVNKTTYELQHMALDQMVEHNLFYQLVNHPAYFKGNSFAKQQANRRYTNFKGTTFSQLNQEQQETVRNILSKRDHLPYILYGPPGTGKTSTIVGAIEQIVRTTKSYVLLCATSNSACDEIAERLAKILNYGEMFRMYAKAYRPGTVSDTIKSVSNWDQDSIRLPPLSHLYRFRVICTTVANAGCFTRARISNNGIWRADHFGYVFIDECASANESLTWIPIAGLCTSRNKVHAKIILAGDPKQLGPATKSKFIKHTHCRSWLEKLCELPLYTAKNGKFDRNFISMLVKNYRSHPSILRVSNKLFYDDKLEALASEDLTNRYINSDLLPSKEFPIIFKSVQGNCHKSGSDTSLYNETEIDEVVTYVMKLLHPSSEAVNMPLTNETDIGVISPYKKQCRKISQRFKDLNINNITVGTTEVFQGKEKSVMIISTVRSGDLGLGFVRAKKRFNVLMTRAKSLLIVVGDPFALSEDNAWCEFLKLCLDNNGFIQSDQPFAF